MHPFEDGIEMFGASVLELEEGVFRETIECVESKADSEGLNAPGLAVFGDLDLREEWMLQENIFCDSVAINCGIGTRMNAEYYLQEEIIGNLREQGLYSDDQGMSVNDMLRFMTDYSPYGDMEIYVEEGSLSGLNELCTCIEAGETVICYVNSSVLHDDAMVDIPGLNADQMIRVIGIDMSDGENEYVVVNDTAEQNGSGKHIPLNAFLKAWAVSDFYAISLSPRRGYAS